MMVGVSVPNNGSDRGQAPPMIEQIEQRTGQQPAAYLVDAASTDKQSGEALAAMQVPLYGAVPGRPGTDPFAPQLTDSAAVAAWRQRMRTADAQAISKQRSPTAERVNADLRTSRTMDRLLVRGTGQVLCVALRNAVALTVMRWVALAPLR